MSTCFVSPVRVFAFFFGLMFCVTSLAAEETAPVAQPVALPATGGAPVVVPAPGTTASVPAADVRPFLHRESLGDYTLAWSDEFNGDKLDTTLWDTRTDTKYWSTQQTENVSVSGGYLHLALKKEKAGKSDYSGAGVVSKRLFRYGFYEASIKLPPGKGWHSTFFMTAYKTDIIGARQEIDVMESDSIDLKLFTTNLHAWKPIHRFFGPKRNKTNDLSLDFHVYGCEFTPQKVRFYFDGEYTGSIDATEIVHDDQSIWITSFAAPLAKTYHVDDTKLPGEVLVDWVRFYEKTK